MVTVVWSDRTITARFSKEAQLVGPPTISDADGWVRLRGELTRRVQTNADLVEARREQRH